MEFRTGKDYPWMCEGCRAAVDQCVDAVEIGPDTDDEEAPLMLAGDMRLLCGGGECDCDCSIGNPSFDNEFDILCRVHGGTEEEQQTFQEQLCVKDGHWFPLNRLGYCLTCRKVKGQAEPMELTKV